MSEPIYKKIENHVLDLIKSNELKQGDFIPTEMQLSEQFNVARMTVRSALNNLVNDGYITRQRGVGTRVSNNQLIDDIGTVRGFTEEMHRKGIEVSNILVELTVLEATEELKEKLQLDEKENVWEIKRIRLANNKRVSYMMTYMPVKMFPNLKRIDCENSLYQYIQKQYTEKIVTSDRLVRAVISDDEVMHHLNLNDIEPLLYITQVSKLTNGQVFEYSHTYHIGYTLTLSALAK